MIRSEVGVTSCTTLAAETVCACEPPGLAFTPLLECLLTDRGVFWFFAIQSPFRPSYIDLIPIIPSHSYASRLHQPVPDKRKENYGLGTAIRVFQGLSFRALKTARE